MNFSLSSLIEDLREKPRTFIIGNGGSYANAIHIANDLLAAGIPAFTLDPATMAASANDYGWESIYSRWLLVVGSPGDILIAMSGSGKSPNILAGIRAAEYMGMKVYKIFGAERGEDMQQAEEAQINIGHQLWRALK